MIELGEWITVLWPSGSGRAVVLAEDGRRLVVRPRGAETDHTVWLADVEQDPEGKREYAFRVPDNDPLLGPCARCGKTHDEHPGGYCPDGVGADEMVAPNAPMWEDPRDHLDQASS